MGEARNGVSTRYAYDANDQLERIETQGKTWQYRYDASGNRTQIVDQGKAVALLNDGLDRLSEYDAGGKLVARNVFAGLDEPLVRIDDQGEVSYYLADGLGSVMGLVDKGGQVTDSYAYDAWGKVVARVGSTVQPFGFTGRENDGNGLYGYRARYFDPSIGRFTQKDPIGFDGGDLNLYRYVLNNPGMFKDPLGLASMNAQIYLPFGPGVTATVGVNPDGGPFIIVGGGLGFGAGGGYNPSGNSPGYSPSNSIQVISGIYGGFAANAAGYGVELTGRSGSVYPVGEPGYPYREAPGLDNGGSSGIKGGLGLSGGIEIGIVFPGDKSKRVPKPQPAPKPGNDPIIRNRKCS